MTVGNTAQSLDGGFYYRWFGVAIDWSEGDAVEASVTSDPEPVPAIPAAVLAVLLMLLAAAGVGRL